MLSSLLARITVVAPDRACILVQFAVNVGARWMIAQIEIGGVQSWVSTPENQRNVTTMFKIIVSSCRLLSKFLEQNFRSFNMSERFRTSGTYSAGGRQQPDSMGVSSASLYCFRVCMKLNCAGKITVTEIVANGATTIINQVKENAK